jgi:hypothetical protein
MNHGGFMPKDGRHTRRDLILVAALAFAVAILSAKPYAGGWNDGSRLASVESLVDRGTFVIDDSIFVKVSPNSSPYTPDFEALSRTGTLDRLYINGHYYSDKSPVPALLLAGVYGTVKRLTGLSACESPATYCKLMNLTGAGVPYVAAAVGIFVLSRLLGLSRQGQWLITASMAFTTVAPAYTRTVNNHIMLLGVVTTILTLMVWIETKAANWLLWLALGTATGLGYTIDLGLGPIILASTGGWIAYRAVKIHRVGPVVFFGITAFPWLALHHTVNYLIAGTLGPANARPEYLQWPGSPFDAATMTGHLHHTVLDFFVYSLDLLWGQKGIISHNLPLSLAFVAAPVVLRMRGRYQATLLSALLWSGGAFALYAATSNNYSGLCVSVRWFVPMLAPAYLVLALLVRDRPEFELDLILLSAVNAVWALMAWRAGWWSSPPLAWHWIIMSLGLCVWGGRYAWPRIKTDKWRNLSQTARSIRPAHAS